MRVPLSFIAATLVALPAVGAQKPAKDAQKPTAPAAAVATVDGQAITADQLDAQLGNRLFRLRSDEYGLKRPVLDELIAKALFDQEAKARKLSVDELMAAEVDAKAKKVTDEEVTAVYESAKQNFANVPEPDARKQIAEGMQRTRVAQRRQAFMTELRAKHAVKILMEAPRASLTTANEPGRGPATAPVTLVVFSDFQCPYCSRVGSVVADLQKRYGDSLRFVFRNFPLPMHRYAAKAAEAGACANEQGKFWELHDKLFASQGELGQLKELPAQIDAIKRYATELGLDGGAFGQCVDSGRFANKVRADMQEGSTFGVGGTPTLFVNGRLMTSGANPELLAQAIDQELAGAPPKAAAKN